MTTVRTMKGLAMDVGCAMFPCVGGCGKPMAFGEGPCEDCVRLAEHYDAKEVRASAERMHALRYARVAKESAHLGAVEQGAPRRGVFTFLGWKAPGPVAMAPCANAERVAAESEAAPKAADRQRRSELLAKLPRIQCGVRRVCALPRMDLWNSDVSLCTVGVVLVWDVLRWTGCAAMDSVARFCRRRDLRGRLGVTGMVVGAGLGLLVSALAWGVR